MSEHIIVPLDGSAYAENAVPYAGKLAEVLDLPLRFIHVANAHDAVDTVGRSAERFEKYVGDQVDRFGLDSLQYTTRFVQGVPAREILAEAEGLLHLS